MAGKGFSVDRVIRVWDDSSGECLWVGEDGDALGLVEIRRVSPEGKILSRTVLPREHAFALAYALIEYCENENNFTRGTNAPKET